MNDPQLDAWLSAALARLRAELSRSAPVLAERVWAWLQQLAASSEPADYFRHPLAFPALSLPHWLAQSLYPDSNAPLAADIVYSTVNGYYYIRLVDNVMDGHVTVERELLPAAGFFHTQFQGAYQAHFAAGHPFWEVFRETWFHAAELTLRDALLTDVDEAVFWQVAGQKVSAVKIPLTAVAFFYNQPERLPSWLRFVERLGGWHQMWNDVFDWHKDLKYGARTYFLAEAARRQHADETPAAWAVREGVAWGLATLNDWLTDLHDLARPLQSAPLLAYLAERETLLREKREQLLADLGRWARLAQALK